MAIAFPPDLPTVSVPMRRKRRGGYTIAANDPIAQKVSTMLLFERPLSGTSMMALKGQSPIRNVFGTATAKAIYTDTPIGTGINLYRSPSGNITDGAFGQFGPHLYASTDSISLTFAFVLNDTNSGSLYNRGRDGSGGWGVDIDIGPGGVSMGVVTTSAGDFGFACASTSSLAVGVPAIATCTFRQGIGSEIWLNGVREASYATSTTTFRGVSDPEFFNLDPLGTNNVRANFTLCHFSVASPPLSDDEVKRYHTSLRRTGLPPFVVHPTDMAFTITASGLSLSKALSESLAITDTRRNGAGKLFADSLAVADSRLAAIIKTLADPINVADTAQRAANKGLIEPISLTDNRAMMSARKLLEALNISDAGVQAMLNAGGQMLSKMLSESLSLSDNIKKSQIKAVLESLSITDVRLVMLGKQIAESLAITDSRSLATLHQIAESLGLADNAHAVIAGAALYFFVNVAQAGYKVGDNPANDGTLGGGQA